MDNLGGLMAYAMAGFALFVGGIALVIGLTVGYVVGTPSDTEVVKQEVKVKTGNATKATSTKINFDLRK